MNMPKITKIVWSLAIIFGLVLIIAFSFTVISVGVGLAALVGIYKYYFARKKIRKYEAKPHWHPSGEVIDLPKNPTKR